MKKGLTLIEILVAIVVLFLLYALFTSGSCKTSVGRNLEIVSQENSGVMIKRHWRDVDSGECFYTYGEDGGGAIYPEDCK